MTNALGNSFARLLIEDVIAAASRRLDDDTQGNRRHWVRAVFAAIEDLSWDTRERVREVCDETGDLTPLAAMALRETHYQVDSKGRVHPQTRYVPLPTMVKLLVAQTKLLQSDFTLDFSNIGWRRFNDALDIRNRITHPKSPDDLRIADPDMTTINDGFSWFLSATLEISISAHAAYVFHIRSVQVLLDQLRSGDPAALAAYHAELNRDPE